MNRHRGAERERGSMIIFAVGVLVLLAVLAAVFLTTAQQERDAGVAAVARHARDQQGAQDWMDYISGIIAKDLFDPMTDGWVTFPNPVPPTRFIPPGFTAAVPVAFERWDYPYTRPGTVGTTMFNKAGDDPWLASTEPQVDWNQTADVLGIPESSLTYDGTPGFPWTWANLSKVHPQGLFYKINPEKPMKADPLEDPVTYRELFDPAWPDGTPGGTTGIFNVQMSSNPLDPINDTEFADADGDGRYDSRWTWIPFLSGPQGLTVYGAVRIVDLSAMVNVNSHLDFEEAWPALTPADMDLRRMLRMVDYSPFAPDPHTDYTVAILGNGTLTGGEGDNGYAMLPTALGYTTDDYPANPLWDTPNPWTTTAGRTDAYVIAGRSRVGLFDSGGFRYAFTPFGGSDEVELRAFAGRNNAANRARIEVVLDEPNMSEGPLRSDIDTELEAPIGVQQYMVDIRHRLTTMSASRRIGPQIARWPTGTDWDRTLSGPLSTGPRAADDLGYSLVGTTVKLPYRTAIQSRTVELLEDIFRGFAQSLAPYALQDPTVWDPAFGYLSYGWDFINQGGIGTGGWEDFLAAESPSQFAIRTAAHLAVNTWDLFEDNSPPTNALPTKVRLSYAMADQAMGATGEVLTLVEAGAVPTVFDIVPPPTVGGSREVWLYGNKPQPFLVEAASFVIMKDEKGGPPPFDGTDTSDELKVPTQPGDWYVRIDPTRNAEAPYKALYVELRNPYNFSITLYEPGVVEYELRLGRTHLGFCEAIPILDTVSVPAPILLEARGSANDRIVIEVVNDKLGGHADRIRLRNELGIPAGVRVLDLDPFASGADFWEHDYNQVELWRTVDFTAREKMLVDVMGGGVDFPKDPMGVDTVPGGSADEGIIAYEAYIQRYAEAYTIGKGMPSYIIGDDDQNAKDAHSEVMGGVAEDSEFDHYFLMSLPGRTVTEVGFEDKTFASSFPFEPFQLFTLAGSLTDDLYRVGDLANIPAIGPVLMDPTDPDEADNWVTLGRMLARPIDDPKIGPAGTKAYTVPGHDVLNLSRSVVDGYDPLTLDAIDSEMRPLQMMPALPIALRVFDMFRCDYTDFLSAPPIASPMEAKAGLVNINTASYEVIRGLPFTQPNLVGPGYPPALLSTHNLAATIVSYRDRRSVTCPFVPNIVDFGATIGDREVTHRVEFARDEPGFTSIGELMMLYKGDLLGTDLPQQPGLSGAIDALYGNNPDLAIVDFDPTDDDAENDAEERTMIFSALSNIVTVRSDTFCVYLRLRGYAEGDRLAYPSMDERWVAVIDRSNVVRPNDKPRILFMERVE
ncbi:MAG: hypothetical protein KAS72_11930 [Phycisphaerales bacterium]|nr:hypothetical protein [Phycisphaerales bacterium]